MKNNELRVFKYLDPKGIIASDKVTDGVKDQIKRRKLQAGPFEDCKQ